jgi:hypothetical protein
MPDAPDDKKPLTDPAWMAIDQEFAELRAEILRITGQPQAGSPNGMVLALEALKTDWRKRAAANDSKGGVPEWRRPGVVGADG